MSKEFIITQTQLITSYTDKIEKLIIKFRERPLYVLREETEEKMSNIYRDHMNELILLNKKYIRKMLSLPKKIVVKQKTRASKLPQEIVQLILEFTEGVSSIFSMMSTCRRFHDSIKFYCKFENKTFKLKSYIFDIDTDVRYVRRLHLSHGYCDTSQDLMKYFENVSVLDLGFFCPTYDRLLDLKNRGIFSMEIRGTHHTIIYLKYNSDKDKDVLTLKKYDVDEPIIIVRYNKKEVALDTLRSDMCDDCIHIDDHWFKKMLDMKYFIKFKIKFGCYCTYNVTDNNEYKYRWVDRDMYEVGL